jgi:hypothetical protein
VNVAVWRVSVASTCAGSRAAASVLSFPAALDRDVTTALRAAGFRFNKVLQHWEGLARFDEANSLVKAHDGTAQRVAAPPAPPSPAPAQRAAAD